MQGIAERQRVSNRQAEAAILPEQQPALDPANQESDRSGHDQPSTGHEEGIGLTGIPVVTTPSMSFFGEMMRMQGRVLSTTTDRWRASQCRISHGVIRNEDGLRGQTLGGPLV